MSNTELSFDGVGINGPNEYRDRLATFNRSGTWTAEQIQHYGRLFEAAPEMVKVLGECDKMLRMAARNLRSVRMTGTPSCFELMADDARAIIERVSPTK